jgi:tetratricopeptide (TPR) repeat protein
MFWRKPYDRAKTVAAADVAKARGRVRKAVKLYLKVLSNGDDAAVRAKVAPLLAKLGKEKDAREHFDKAAEMFLAAGFRPKGIAVWTVAAQTFPELVEYWERIANEHVKAGKRQDAVQALLLGRSQLRKKRQRPLAVLLLRQVLELQPGHVEATFDLADLLRREGTKDEAKWLLDQLLVRIGRARPARRRVRAALFRVEPSFRGALDWALAR